MLVTPRCWKQFARNRERPVTPNEKSSSLSFSKRFCCSSVMMLYAIILLTSGVMRGWFVGRMTPSMRSIGGTPAVM